MPLISAGVLVHHRQAVTDHRAACRFCDSDAHALVDLVLGSQWSGAARIFAVLGLVGLTQPLAFATGWLFVTQGRTREMFLWSLLAFPLNIGVFVGLPFGTLGVATAYSIYYVLQLPGLMWFVGRAGPVSASDMYRACVSAALVSAAVGAVPLAVRAAAHGSDGVVELAVSAPAAVVAAAVALALLPSGRHQCARPAPPSSDRCDGAHRPRRADRRRGPTMRVASRRSGKGSGVPPRGRSASSFAGAVP